MEFISEGDESRRKLLSYFPPSESSSTISSTSRAPPWPIVPSLNLPSARASTPLGPCHQSSSTIHDRTHEDPMEESTMARQGNAVGLSGVPYFYIRTSGSSCSYTLNPIPLDAFLDGMFADSLADHGIQFHALRLPSLPWTAAGSKSFVPLLEPSGTSFKWPTLPPSNNRGTLCATGRTGQPMGYRR